MTFKLSELLKLPEKKEHYKDCWSLEPTGSESKYRCDCGVEQYNAGQSDLANMEIEVDEEVINVILYAQGILMNYSEDRKRVAHAIASQLPKWLKETK